mmetsp:Transcript_9907/g.9754  ORF Transcript_9907/g.9754 Transcript_9907/m.9754 type:complete len:193 (+) Transcript_9907:832-1410(+)
MSSHIEYLKSYATIELVHYNRKNFKISEDIVLYVAIKNIPNLKVKVFEINTDNYYRKNMAPFTTNINLDGLVCKTEKDYSFSHLTPQMKRVEEFTFTQFNNKRGLFVFEFIGNGLSSRAIIQKGNLNFVQKTTIAGQMAFILDEHRGICKGEYTGLFFDNQFFKADENGRIIVPFGRNKQEGKALIIHDGYA